MLAEALDGELQKYRIDQATVTLEHVVPGLGVHLLFRTDIDGELHDCPYKSSGSPESSTPMWINEWEPSPTCWKTRIPNFRGKGDELILHRKLLSASTFEMKVEAISGDSGKQVAGPAFIYFERVSQEGPRPVAFLRSKGKSLNTAEQRKEALQKVISEKEEIQKELSGKSVTLQKLNEQSSDAVRESVAIQERHAAEEQELRKELRDVQHDKRELQERLALSSKDLELLEQENERLRQHVKAFQRDVNEILA